MKWLILLLAFVFGFIWMLWFTRSMEMRRMRIRKRIQEIEAKEWQEEDKTYNSKDKKTLVNFVWRMLSKIPAIRRMEEKLQTELKKANILMKSSEFIVLIFLSAVIGSILGYIIAGGSIERGVWLGAITWIIPLAWLKSQVSKRKVKLEKQLPEMINMTANSLKAGYSLVQSLELLSREMAAPLSEEIQRMLQEMRFGASTEKALMNFNERIDSKDLDLIITAMLIQRQVGGNLAEILQTIGSTIRERIRIQGEIKSLTAQGRMSMWIFMLLPIGLGLFISMANPEYMNALFTHPLGIGMLVMAVIGQFIGYILIKKIINIEV